MSNKNLNKLPWSVWAGLVLALHSPLTLVVIPTAFSVAMIIHTWGRR